VPGSTGLCFQDRGSGEQPNLPALAVLGSRGGRERADLLGAAEPVDLQRGVLQCDLDACCNKPFPNLLLALSVGTSRVKMSC